MLELWRRRFGSCVATVAVTDRGDGDVHPLRVPVGVLRDRQRASTGRIWRMMDQVHGIDAVMPPGPSPGAATGPSTGTSTGTSTGPPAVVGVGDVLVGDGHSAIAVWAADCAPLMLFAPDGTPTGCHAGWRGLSAGVVDVAVAACGSPVAAVLGPTIHPCCYEFAPPEIERVAAGIAVDRDRIASSTSWGSPALDVPAAVALALAAHGVGLDVVGPCTGCDDRWFSHRRGDSGRHAVVAWNEAAA
ncbi:MAG TPA: laccase domain-containing protein [Ilumatobacteraceae bacterium]|nr:laccase domain-containing protein [Ilumatobacteraceae bacterium]